MTKHLPLALHTACAAAFALLTTGAGAQTSPPGRTAFDHSGCQACHAYSARRGAPSVRDLLVTFEGEPEKALKAIDQNEKHAADLMSGKITETDLKSIAEWISGAAFPEHEAAVIAPAPPAVAAVPVVAAPSMATEMPAAAVAAPIVKLAPPPPPPPRLAATGTVSRIAIESGKKSDLLLINLTGKEPDELDIKRVDGKLIISLPGIALADGVPANLAGTRDSRAVGTVQSSDADGTLLITVTARAGDLKYFASQGKHRLAIELTAIPAKKTPVSAPLVAAAPTTATAPTAAPGKAPTKAAAGGKAPSEKAAPIAKTAPATPPAATKAEPAAKTAALDNAKARQDAKAEADAKARKDAEAQALAKKEAEAKAKKDSEIKAAQTSTKKDSDAKAKQESADAARKEAEMLASLKASAEALKGGGMSGMSAGEASGGRRDRSKLKAPDKFRDEPCPPIAESDPIGNVDEARAKDIIERVGCPQCHAFVAKKTGPPFKKVFEKVKGNPSCVMKKLKTNKEHREEGVTDDLKGPEFKIIADYIASRAK